MTQTAKARLVANLRYRQGGGFQEFGRVFDPEANQVLMWRPTDVLPEESCEMIRAEGRHTSECGQVDGIGDVGDHVFLCSIHSDSRPPILQTCLLQIDPKGSVDFEQEVHGNEIDSQCLCWRVSDRLGQERVLKPSDSRGRVRQDGGRKRRRLQSRGPHMRGILGGQILQRWLANAETKVPVCRNFFVVPTPIVLARAAKDKDAWVDRGGDALRAEIPLSREGEDDCRLIKCFVSGISVGMSMMTKRVHRGKRSLRELRQAADTSGGG